MDTVSDALRESFDELGLESPFATGAETPARGERGDFPGTAGEDFSPFAESEEVDSELAIEPEGEVELEIAMEMEVEESAPWAGAETLEQDLALDPGTWAEAEDFDEAHAPGAELEVVWPDEVVDEAPQQDEQAGERSEDESLVWLDFGAAEGEDDGSIREETAAPDPELMVAPEIATLRTLLESEAGAGTGLADRVKGAAELALGPGLGLGTRGAAVASLQRALAGLGHDLAVDGEFGANTERVVRAFQGESGLEPDGIVDARTKTAIAQALSAPDRMAAGDTEYDSLVVEQALAQPARVQPTSIPIAAGPLNFQVIDAAGKPLAQARWALEQEGTVVEGALDANGGTGALHPALRRFDRTRPFRVHVDGHVCSIVRGAMLLAGDPEVEYGGQFVDWTLADAADARQRDAFWKEYELARKLRAPRDVFRFLQHDHVMRRPIKLLARGAQVVFQAHPVAIRLGPLVRYVDAGRALVWAELETPGLVRVLFAKAKAQQELPRYTETPAATQARHGSTVRVGGRHYALLWLDALEPDTAYQYTLELGPMPMTGSIPQAESDFTEAVFPRSVPRGVANATATSLALRSFGNNTRWLFFRTLPKQADTVRFAHGSCRKWPGDHGEAGTAPGPDMLERFGAEWLPRQKWAAWPQFFVHTGDQIYADDVGMKQGEAVLRHRFASVVPGPAPKAADDVAFGAWAGRFGFRYAPLERAGLPLRNDAKELQKLRPRAVGATDNDIGYSIKEALRAAAQPGHYRNRTPLAKDLATTRMTRALRFKLRVLNGLLWNPPDHAGQVPQVDRQKGLLAPQVYKLKGPPARELRLEHPSAGETGGVHAADYAEYASLYEQAWSTPATSRMLAHVPSFMIFDDHEVTDDWNADPGWLKIIHSSTDLLRYWPTTITDALASYWLYQGWGNLAPERWADDPRVQILERCRKSGRDALPDLRRLIHARSVQATAPGTGAAGKLDWHYALPTGKVPFLVVDLRTDRDVNGSGGMSASRLQWMERALLASTSPMAFVVLPVPYLMPDPMLFAFRNPGFTARLAGARSVDAFKRGSDIEHPAGNPVWDQVKGLLAKVQQRGGPLKTIVLVSGDIHFSCNLDGQLPDSTRPPRLLQLVSSGLQQKISAAKQGQLAGAYKGALNAIARSQGVDTHRGMRITVGGMQGRDGAMRNFLYATSLALVDARVVQQGSGAKATPVPLIVQTHLTGEKPGVLTPYTFRHMTQFNGTAVMSLKDPGFDNPASPKDYPAARGGIGLTQRLDEAEPETEPGTEMEALPAVWADEEGGHREELERSSLEPGQSVIVDGQRVRTYAELAAWYAARRAVLHEYRDAFKKEGYREPDGLADLVVAADARIKTMRPRGAQPVGDSHMEGTMGWRDRYLEVVYACDQKADGIAMDRFRATREALERMIADTARLKPQLRALQRSAFRAAQPGKLKEIASTFATLLDSAMAAKSWIAEAATRLDDIVYLGTTLRAQKALHDWKQPWHELMRKATNARITKLMNVAQGLNKVMAAWQLVDGALALVTGGRTAADRSLAGISFSATLASAGGTLLGASAFFSLYNNLYIGPMVKRIVGQITVLQDRLSTGINHPIIQLGMLDSVDWRLEPGGRAMFEFMHPVMRASDASRVPAISAAVARYFASHKKAFDAGTPRRNQVELDYDDFQDKRQWVFAFRDDLWGMLYGDMPVP
ncbi:MAG: hypothetical protein EOO30_20495 [Comamonadaceae bacterium]|nr:MAG: hypothetical protein EOO30_20495 [Comamonadaceae bacterium]